MNPAYNEGTANKTVSAFIRMLLGPSPTESAKFTSQRLSDAGLGDLHPIASPKGLRVALKVSYVVPIAMVA